MSDESPEEMYRRAGALASTLYPELEREDLNALATRLVVEAGYSLDAAMPGYGLRVGDRASQVSRAALERLFLFDLWSKGVCYADGATDDPRVMADAIGAFVVARASVAEMERRFPFIRFNEDARPHEAGRLVDERWRSWLESSDELGRLLQPLLAACARRPRLRALLPFTSHEVVLFSRTTGYPYDAMIACARPVVDPASNEGSFIERFVPGRFEVFERRADSTLPSDAPRSFGTGDGEWAAQLLERELPAHWGAAVDGTAADVRGK